MYIEYCNQSQQGQTSFKQNRAQHCKLITINFEGICNGQLTNKLTKLFGKQLTKYKRSNKENARESHNLAEIFRGSELMKIAIDHYIKALQAIRIEGLSAQAIYNRLSMNALANEDQHTKILSKIHSAYKNELMKQNAIDFDDMITNATDAITKKIFTPNWQHILVDEFQDISSTRYQLLNNLVNGGLNVSASENKKEIITQNQSKVKANKKVKLTVVGDDWQSIYRFSGGNLKLTTQFNSLVGKHTLSKLQKTFRYNNSIADVAGKFVMQNPQQYKKQVTTHNKVTDSKIFLHDDKINQSCTENSITQKVTKVINLLKKNNPQQTIAVIARFRNQLNQVRDTLSKSSLSETIPSINFWTYHSSKGLEADSTILIGFEHGQFGFPVINQDPGIEDLLLPQLDKFPHSEERRLFYVGLTRAKQQTHIIANSTNYSSFIIELIENKYDINILSTDIKKMTKKIS